MGMIGKKMSNEIEASNFRIFSEIGERIKSLPVSSVSNSRKEIGLGCEYNHRFADGCYIREMLIPKDIVIVTEIHKTKHPFFIMRGDVSIKSQDGKTVRIKGPYSGITEPWTQRILYTHRTTLWITVHVTKETDIEKIAQNILASDDEIKKLAEGGRIV